MTINVVVLLSWNGVKSAKVLRLFRRSTTIPPKYYDTPTNPPLETINPQI